MHKILKKCLRWVGRRASSRVLPVAVGAGLTAPAFAALLGVTLTFPLISYDNQGTTTYDATTDQFFVNASPLAIRLAPTDPPVIITPVPGLGETLVINATVDDTGALTGGVSGDDLLVVGQVDLGASGFFSGVLLTGEVSGFGFQDSGGTTDFYDFTFTVTGGQLASLYPSVVGVEVTSEQSDFTGDFGVDFSGEAKGTLGSVTPVVAALGDRVWEDLNADGIQNCVDGGANDPNFPADGIIGNAGDSGPECDSGISGVTVNLLDPGAGGCGTGDESFIEARLTDAEGFYRFADLTPGGYCVEIIKPLGLECTLDNQGNDNALDSDVVDQGDGTCQTVDPVQNPIDLVAGETDLTWDAGLVRPVAALGDRVWEDLNANGIQDCSDSNGNGILGDVDPLDPFNPNVSDQGKECGDPSSGGAGIAGVPVNLFQPNENGDCTVDLGKQVVTGTDGLYLFPGLVPGDYCVQFDIAALPDDFCKTDVYELGAPQFTALNVGGDPAVDSDADPTDGKTDTLTLGAGETNRTLDAGIVCPAKIGDLVWEDVDQDGLQNGEPAIGGVTVNLFDCGPDGVAGTPDDIDTGESRVTDNVDGMYMFGAEPGVFDLPPGDYYVKFDPATFPPGFDFTVPKAPSGDDRIDSDCLPPNGITACTTLGSRDINLDRDCGLIPPPPPECDLDLDKKCRVEPQPSADIAKCSGKLQQFTVVWDGPSGITIDSVNMGTTSASGTVNKGDEVTFFGPYSSNDVVVNISGPVTGQSKFHVSCSDDDFNGSDDCGKLAGDGKSNDASLLNLWMLEGFIDADGQVLDCNPESDGAFSQNCTFTPQSQPSCDTVGKPTSLTFKYTGGACPGDNDQGSKADCSGTVDGMEMASIAVNTADGYTVSPDAVNPDGLFTITRGGLDFKSNTDIDLSNTGGTQLNDVHTSCSAPLAVGDEFGAITLVAINGQTGGVDVTYQYVVTNSGDPLSDIMVTDVPLGDVGMIDSLDTNDSATFTLSTSIDGTTVNTGTASGTLEDGSVCSDSDSVLVEAVIPPCVVTPGEFKLEDNKIKWKLTNAGDKVATVESIELSAPDEFGEVKKVKLNGDIFKDDTRPMTWTFTDADFINDLKNRQIKVGDTKELTFETTQKFKTATADQISITVNFREGCSVTFEPGAQVFVCKDSKPIDSLSMIWDGPDGVDVTSPTGAMVTGVVNGDEVTFSGLSGLGNDIVWAITDGVDGISTFHVSCSDEDMNGPEDCGKPQGDGKSNDKGLNLWQLEGMAGTNGIGLDCSALP